MKYFVFFFLFILEIFAQNQYGFLKHNQTNLRVGPGRRFPILWVYQQKHLPVKVIDIYSDWYKIEDKWGQTGWIISHSINLEKRKVMTDDLSKVFLYKEPDLNSKIKAVLQGRFILNLKTCENNFCLVETNNLKGYIQNQDLWGTK